MRRKPVSTNYWPMLCLYGAALLVCVAVPVVPVDKIRGAFFISPDSYRTTTGTVLRSAVVPDTLIDNFRYEITYKYTVDGKAYTSNLVSFGKDAEQGIWFGKRHLKRYRKNHPVTVYYLPTEPDFAVLEPNVLGATRGIVVIQIVSIITALTGLGWCLRGLRHQKLEAAKPKPMSQQFFFHYDSNDKDRFEIPEVGGEYGALIECDRELIQGWGLWSSFVAQYRAERPTSEDTGEGYEPSDEPPSEEEMEELLDYMNWGPSAAFEPDELRQWAVRWIEIIEMLNDGDAIEVFPDDPDLHRHGGYYGREWMVGELEDIIEMAECAMQHNVRLTMSQLLD